MDDTTQGGAISRQESAKLHDDSALIAEQEGEAGTSGAHVAGGRLATEIGTRDELEQATGDAGLTRVTGEDKVQPADNSPRAQYQ